MSAVTAHWPNAGFSFDHLFLDHGKHVSSLQESLNTFFNFSKSTNIVEANN